MLDMVWRAFSFAAWSWVGDYVISTQSSSLRNTNSHLALPPPPPLTPADAYTQINFDIKISSIIKMNARQRR